MLGVTARAMAVRRPATSRLGPEEARPWLFWRTGRQQRLALLRASGLAAAVDALDPA